MPVDTCPERAQGIPGVVQNGTFLNVVSRDYKQFSDPGKDVALRLSNSPRKYVPIRFKQGRVIKHMPRHARVRRFSVSTAIS